MKREEIRLECLKLAYKPHVIQTEVLAIAKAFEEYITSPYPNSLKEGAPSKETKKRAKSNQGNPDPLS
jgi:hypothetical protein